MAGLPFSVERDKISRYLCNLMLCASCIDNDKEIALIDSLDALLTDAEKGACLDNGLLKHVRYKISRVSCFAEKYGEIVDFLKRYHTMPKDRVPDS
jgi:hypothetical protein